MAKRLARRLSAVAASAALAAGALSVGAAVVAPGSASAATCTAIIGTGCTITGTATLTGGILSELVPGQLTWSGTLTGVAQSLVDTTAADQGYTVTDATGSAAGWHSQVSATTFTSGAKTLPNTGTFVTNGSVTSVTSTTAPTAACAVALACTLPTNTTTYPVAVTTAASAPTAVTIYDTSATTGVGVINIGGSTAANPVGWWVNVPANALAGTYTSTIVESIVSGP
jgi:hypothetical protein